MRVIITGKDLPLTPSLKTFVREKSAKLDSYHPNITYVKVELDVDRHHKKGQNFRVEGWVKTPRDVLSAGAQAFDMHTAIDQVVGKLAKQLRRSKGKRIAKRRRATR